MTRASLLLLLSSTIGVACAPTERDVDLVPVELALGLDFESGDVLEVAIYRVADVTCATLIGTGPGSAEPVDSAVASAVAVNDGASTTFTFDTLPAEEPLAFHGTVTRGATLLAEDCSEATIPNGGNVEIVIVLAEEP